MRDLIKRHPLISIVAGLVLLALLIFLAPNLWHKVGDSFWHKATTKDEQAIKADEAEGQKWKAVAQEALGRLEEAKRQLAEETQKREAAEKVLNDQHKSTEAARDAYNNAIATAPVPISPDSSTDDLCERARRLGVSCE